MGNNQIGTLIFYMVITLLSFFVMAPLILNTISLFGVQKKFAQTMIEQGIIKAEAVRNMQRKKQIVGVVITGLFTAAMIATVLKDPFSPICLALGGAFGVLKFRKVLSFNSLTVKRFQNTYRDEFDADKLNAYIKKTF